MRGAELARMIGRSAGVAIALVPTTRALADEPCARVKAPSHLSPSWGEALDELRRQISLLPSADCQPMTLSIESSAGEGVRVVAIASDGRRAEREVRNSAHLVATAMGLLMAIPAQGSSAPSQTPSAPSRPHPPTSPPPAERPPVPSSPTTPTTPTTATTHESREFAVWTGLSAGLRLVAPSSTAVVDVEARADLFIDRWLLLATIRSALVSCLGGQGFDCDIYNDVSLGVGVGRRLVAGAAAIDVALEPSVVAMHMEYDGVSGSEESSVEGTEVALRLDASARLAVPVGPKWIITLTMDAGLAPALLVSPVRLAAPANVSGPAAAPPSFPPWTGGLRLGASGALL